MILDAKARWMLTFLLVFCGLWGIKPVWATEMTPTLRQQTLVIGRVTNKPKKHYKELKPIVDFVAVRLKDTGILHGDVVLAKNNQQMHTYLKEGKVDWITEGVFSSLDFMNQNGAQPLLRRWKKGVPEYHTVFITKNDSDIHTLADLKGKKIALQDKGSTSAFKIPVAMMTQNQLALFALKSPRQTPPQDKVSYLMAGGELNIVMWVFKGLADAGAFSNLDWQDPKSTPKRMQKGLRVFHKSDPFPRAIELVRKGMDSNLKKKLKSLLLTIHNNPEAAPALRSYQKTKQFDDFPGGVEKSISIAKQLRPLIEATLTP